MVRAALAMHRPVSTRAAAGGCTISCPPSPSHQSPGSTENGAVVTPSRASSVCSPSSECEPDRWRLTATLWSHRKGNAKVTDAECWALGASSHWRLGLKSTGLSPPWRAAIQEALPLLWGSWSDKGLLEALAGSLHPDVKPRAQPKGSWEGRRKKGRKDFLGLTIQNRPWVTTCLLNRQIPPLLFHSLESVSLETPPETPPL